ncbi:hypothetical protein CYMTET_51079 [Cymbomonas tetramitiformis]|uniref:Uncharacterized protein n=1 Tax=Cymbomonas tetramitiformis TaxID=36881 RepID=A0AAE0BNI4_9CHLO|nr:hypothetical protein CYMTET_51079 [Cymbomonas tetramitiformis]
MARLLAVAFFALVGTQSASAIVPTRKGMKDMAVNYWVRQVGPSDDITKVSKTVEEAAKPGKEDMKQMAANYWVRQVGPSDDIESGRNSSSQDVRHNFTMSFAGTPLGMLTPEQYLEDFLGGRLRRGRRWKNVA